MNFPVNTYFPTHKSEQRRSTMKFISNISDFRQNLKIRFSSDNWLQAIDFQEFLIVGGCIVNAVCQLPFHDTQQQDINIINISSSRVDFETTMKNTIKKLQMISLRYTSHQIKVEKIPGSCHYDIFLPCGIKLNFKHERGQYSATAISRILYNFDMDVCQVAFTGKFIFTCNMSDLLVLMIMS